MQFKLNVIVGAAAALLAGTVMAQDLVVKIGHVAPTSGGIAHLGKDNENGARMAIDELNAKGVMIGGKKAKFELLAEDDDSGVDTNALIRASLIPGRYYVQVRHYNRATGVGNYTVKVRKA